MIELSTDVDTGTGYGRSKPSSNTRLTSVGPGTPMGEAMRRYWHPVASSAALTSELPHRTRVLGEDLIVFRDGEGRAGVVFERCTHRGTSLYYGRIENDGIRCCYHGWKFDVQGNCVEQACEPALGARRDVARQPWYPVEERYGLVFVYMGPPDRKPPLPRWDVLEVLDEGDQIFSSVPMPGGEVTGILQDFNWLQIYENGLDACHVTWLHTHHSGPQIAAMGAPTGLPESFFDPSLYPGSSTFLPTEFGIAHHQNFEMTGPESEAARFQWRLESLVPNILALPDFSNVVPDARQNSLLWFVPSDDTHHRVFFATRCRDMSRMERLMFGVSQNNKPTWAITPEESQRFPSDIEAQGSQGPITLHSEETLVTSDQGIVMLRRMLGKIVDDVEAGRDPVGIFDDSLRHVNAGIFTMSPGSADERVEKLTTSGSGGGR